MLYFDDLMKVFLSFSCTDAAEGNPDLFSDDEKSWAEDALKRLTGGFDKAFCADKNLENAITDISTSEDEAELLSILSLMLYPGNFSYGDIFLDDFRKGLADEKINVAIQVNIDAGMPYDEIKKVLNLKEDAFGESSVPAIIRSKDLEIESLRSVNNVRNFFARFPYASIAEAAKTLKLTNKEIRRIINDLEKEGETIKYSNVLRTTEYEALKKQIIDIKMEDPMVSDQELAYRLEVPITVIRSAVQEAVRIMKMENAQNFAFMAHQSARQYQLVEKEAYKRHKATQNSSSEWLKIMVSARQAIVELYGLKEPEKIDVLHEFGHTSKEERQAVLDAYFATEVIDVDCKQIEMKPEEEKECVNG